MTVADSTDYAVQMQISTNRRRVTADMALWLSAYTVSTKRDNMVVGHWMKRVVLG